MANIYGPYGAGINPVTARPADTGEPGAADTFFGPCSSPTTRDGTVVSYRWLNKILATLRRATRGMGVADDPANDDLLLEAIKRGATLRNVGTQSGAVDVYAGPDASKAHMLRRLHAGSNIALSVVENPAGEHVIRIAATAPGSGPTGNTLANVGDGADVYKGTNSTTEELRGIKGASGSPVSAAVAGDNIELSVTAGAWTILVRNANSPGQAAAQTIISLTEEASPADNDFLLLGKNADGTLRKVSKANLATPTAGGVGSFRVMRGAGAGSVDGGVVPSNVPGHPGTGTWVQRGEWWIAQYGATGPGEALFGTYCLAQRTA